MTVNSIYTLFQDPKLSAEKLQEKSTPSLIHFFQNLENLKDLSLIESIALASLSFAIDPEKKHLYPFLEDLPTDHCLLDFYDLLESKASLLRASSRIRLLYPQNYQEVFSCFCKLKDLAIVPREGNEIYEYLENSPSIAIEDHLRFSSLLYPFPKSSFSQDLTYLHLEFPKLSEEINWEHKELQTLVKLKTLFLKNSPFYYLQEQPNCEKLSLFDNQKLCALESFPKCRHIEIKNCPFIRCLPQIDENWEGCADLSTNHLQSTSSYLMYSLKKPSYPLNLEEGREKAATPWNYLGSKANPEGGFLHTFSLQKEYQTSWYADQLGRNLIHKDSLKEENTQKKKLHNELFLQYPAPRSAHFMKDINSFYAWFFQITPLLHHLGYSFYIEEKEVYITLPCPTALLKNWKSAQEEHPDLNLPPISIAILNGIAPHQEFVEAYQKNDLVISQSEDFLHDQLIHILPSLKRIIDYRKEYLEIRKKWLFFIEKATTLIQQSSLEKQQSLYQGLSIWIDNYFISIEDLFNDLNASEIERDAQVSAMIIDFLKKLKEAPQSMLNSYPNLKEFQKNINNSLEAWEELK